MVPRCPPAREPEDRAGTTGSARATSPTRVADAGVRSGGGFASRLQPDSRAPFAPGHGSAKGVHGLRRASPRRTRRSLRAAVVRTKSHGRSPLGRADGGSCPCARGATSSPDSAVRLEVLVGWSKLDYRYLGVARHLQALRAAGRQPVGKRNRGLGADLVVAATRRLAALAPRLIPMPTAARGRPSPGPEPMRIPWRTRCA